MATKSVNKSLEFLGFLKHTPNKIKYHDGSSPYLLSSTRMAPSEAWLNFQQKGKIWLETSCTSHIQGTNWK
jgi:hypothetical protein